MSNTCGWMQQDWDMSDTYDTDCGGTFVIIEGTPEDNNIRFCCYCGKPIEQILMDFNDDEA